MSSGRAFARAGLLGNPSDGYGGKVLGAPLRDFVAEVTVDSSDSIVISAGGTPIELESLEAAVDADPRDFPDGLEPLVLAALRRVASETARSGSAHRVSGLRIQCTTTVPRQVGLGGSSAMIIATIRALQPHLQFDLSPFDTAEMALAAEVEDLDIAAGPMDRVIQAYEQTMVLDFTGLDRARDESLYTSYRGLLPPMWIAWVPHGGRSSGITHSDLRTRWERGDADVVEAMRRIGEGVDLAVQALASDDFAAFADLVDANFDLRCSVTTVTPEDEEMVALARGAGAAAKLCGSGGAVLIVPRPGASEHAVAAALTRAGFEILSPELVR